MKVFAILAAVVAVASASPATWSVNDLSDAIQNPYTSSVLKPTLVGALDIVMEGLISGQHEGPIGILTAPGVAGTFTLNQLDSALQDPELVSSVFHSYLVEALDEVMESYFEGRPLETISVNVPAFQLSYWSLQELDDAISSPSTNAALRPYLISALDQLMENLVIGGQPSIVIAVPSDVVAEAPVEVSPVAVSPVAISPVPVAPVEVSPAATANPASSSSPLVEIIINIQQSSAQVTPVDVPAPVVEVPVVSPVNPLELALPVEALEPSPVGAVGILV